MESMISVYCENTERSMDVALGTSLVEVCRMAGLDGERRMIAALVNNRAKELNYRIYKPVRLRFFDATTTFGYRVYQRTLMFVAQRAVEQLYPSNKLHIRSAIGDALYCELDERRTFSGEECEALSRRMEDIIAENIPIERTKQPSEDVVSLFRERGYEDKEALLVSRPRLYSSVHRMASTVGYFFGPLAPSTGYIDIFEVQPHHNGFYLVLPDRHNLSVPAVVPKMEKMFSLFDDYAHWVEVLGVPTVGHLNTKIAQGDAGEIIKIAEAVHEKVLASIADSIAEANSTRGVKLVLISGPSSSGKTTTAKRLGIQLRVLGLEPALIELDDYFVERTRTPRDENGEYDFEQERTGWGIFTATLPDGRMTVSQLKTSPAYTKQAAISEALDYNFDILPTYQHIAWGRETVNEWPSVAAKNMAGGNGFNGLPVIQMSYQFTDNNNNVSVSQVNDCYTPMFDIYRGYDGDLQNYDLPVNGKYELALRDLAQRIKAYGKPVLFRLNNEMNTDWTSYSGIMSLLDPDIFQATWRITYKIFEEEGVDNCIWIFNPIAKSCPFSSWGEDMSYYPGLEYVQALGLTYYEDNNNNNVNEYTFRKDYTALYDKNNPVWNKYPWIISEFGCGAGGSASGTQFRNQASQVKYVEGMFADFNDRANNPYLQNIKGAVWFSVNDYVGDLVGNQYELVIDELKDTIQALKEGLAPNKLS